MESKSLLYGLVGFFIGGLLVSIAATTFDKPSFDYRDEASTSMTEMANRLKSRSGDDFDSAFIAEMIVHHEGAVEMAKLSSERAKHTEIKGLSADIINSQEQEIERMKQWQKMWGYDLKAHETNSH